MKPSNYVVYLNVPETDDFYLIHGYSGAVDKVSPEVMRYMLDHADPEHTWHTKDMDLIRQVLAGRELGEITPESLEMLQKRGYLTTMSTAEELRYVERLAGFLHSRKVRDVAPNFMLVPSYECNLRCPYCFETDMRVDLGKMKILQNVMTEPMVNAAFRSMDVIFNDRYADRPELGAVQQRSITLYGGEPLMLETLPVITYILELGKQKGYTFNAITNAVDLHHYLHLLGPDKIKFLQITLDGPKDTHDKKRIGPRHKGGTYDRIIENIKLALPTGVQISVRFHVDFTNIDRARDLTEDLKREGMGEYENFNVYTYPIHNFHRGMDTPQYPMMAIHQMQRAILKMAADKALEPAPPPLPDGTAAKSLKVLVADEGVQTKIKAYVKGQLLGIYNAGIEPCAATTGLYIFDPLWKIYTCWDSVGMPGHETGSYRPDSVSLNELNRTWLSRSPATISECKQCKYAFFHFGGCASLPVGSKGKILEPACYDFQDNFIFSAQRFFNQGIEKILDKETAPIGIQEVPQELPLEIPSEEGLMIRAPL